MVRDDDGPPTGDAKATIPDPKAAKEPAPVAPPVVPRVPDQHKPDQIDFLAREARTIDAPDAPKPIQLLSGRDGALLTRAIEDRVGELKALTKKLNDAGYPLEARKIHLDETALRSDILPRVRSQSEFPLNEQAEGLVPFLAAMIEPIVEAHVRQKRTNKQTTVEVATRYSEFLVFLYETAYADGYAARATTPGSRLLMKIAAFKEQQAVDAAERRKASEKAHVPSAKDD